MTLRRCQLLFALAALLVLGEGAQVWAQVEPAEARRRQAVELHNEGRFDEAIRLLEQAREETDRPGLRARICLELGINYAILGQTELARSSFVTALTLDSSLEIDGEMVKESVVSLFRAERERLRGELRVSSLVAGARVSLDGKRVGVCPLVLRIPIGTHLVEVWDPEGRRQLQQQVLVRPGQVLRIDGRPPEEQPPSAMKGVPPSPPLPRGHAETVARSAPRTRQRIWTWVAAGGALAVAGSGLGLWLAGRAGFREWEQLLGDADDPAATEQHLSELEERVPRLYVAADVMLGLAAGLTVTATVLYFLEGKQRARPESASPPPLVLRFRCGGTGAVLQGTF